MKSFFARHSLKIMFVTMFLLPLVGQGARRAFETNRNRVQDWLPDTYQETKTFNWFREHFAGEEFVLASWEGCTLEDQRLKLFVDKLVPPPGASRPSSYYFESAITGPSTLERLTSEPSNLTREAALERLKGSLVGPDLNQTCAVLALTDAAKFEKPRKIVERILQVADECNIPRADFHMGGSPVDNAAIDKAGEESLFRLAGFAMAIGLVISWWCLRSGRLIAMVFLAGISSAGLSLAVIFWMRLLGSGVELNAILMSMPSLVYVAAISGAIHLSNYYRDTADEDGLEGAPGRALKHAALPLGLATGTTAIGLLSLCINELVPIQLFGFFSATGVVLSLLVLCLSLPAAFQLWPLKKRDVVAAHQHAVQDELDRRSSSGWWAAANFIVDRHGLMTALGVLVLFLGGWGMTQMTTSVHLMRMFPPGAPILKDYTWLENKLGDLVPMEVIVKVEKDNPLQPVERLELIARIENQLRKHKDVKSSISAATFAPPDVDLWNDNGGRLSVSMMARRGVANRKLSKAESRQAFIDAGMLSEDGNYDLWRVSARVGALKNIDYGLFQHDIRQQVEQVLASDAKYKFLLPEKLAGEYKDDFNLGTRLLTLVGINSQASDDPGPDAGQQVIYTGLIPLVYKSQRSLLDNLLWGFVMDLIVVTIVMMIAVREWSAGVVLMLPSIMPVFVVFGVMGWAGIIVDTGTVMAPGVALGVTVDDVVHFMLMYRGGLKRGLGRRESVMLAYKGCARAMYQSWGVIGLGLAVFALSPFTPTQRFGYMMVTLLTAALFGNLVVLPAVLASPLGALFGRRFQLQNRLAKKEREFEQLAPSTNGNGSLHSHFHDAVESEAAHR